MSVSLSSSAAQIGEWRFVPDNSLPIPSAETRTPSSTPLLAAPPWHAPRLAGYEANETREDLLNGRVLARGAPFTAELWLLDHVNRPVGALLAAESADARPAWRLGYLGGDRRVVFFGTPDGASGKPEIVVDANAAHPKLAAYKRYWRHLVGSYDGERFRLYSNGELIAEQAGAPLALQALHLAAFTGAEPYMRLGDLVQEVVVHDEALDAVEIAAAFETRKQMIEAGRREERLHFTAGPYLTTPAENEMRFVWETDRPSRSVLHWGKSVPYEHRVELAAPARLHKHRLTGLDANTPYFYRVTALADDGTKIDSGPLTFRTLPGAGEPLVIALSGDTEARPFVNARISAGIWESRPHLLLLTGDLTDGGRKDERWQWTHEYFAGMTPLASRVPVFPVPGNGEGDLTWFNHYHDLPSDTGYYSRRIGAVELFALDSNLVEHEKREPGFRARQRAWLESALRRSKARWKIAFHHHPTYSSDDDDYGNTYEGLSEPGDAHVRKDFLDLYERHGVDLVLYGHLHSYARTWPLLADRVDRRGIVHVQIGGYGGNHERSGPTHAWFDHSVSTGYHHALIRVFGDGLEMSLYDAEHRLRDSFTLTPRKDR